MNSPIPILIHYQNHPKTKKTNYWQCVLHCGIRSQDYEFQFWGSLWTSLNRLWMTKPTMNLSIVLYKSNMFTLLTNFVRGNEVEAEFRHPMNNIHMRRLLLYINYRRTTTKAGPMHYFNHMKVLLLDFQKICTKLVLKLPLFLTMPRGQKYSIWNLVKP